MAWGSLLRGLLILLVGISIGVAGPPLLKSWVESRRPPPDRRPFLVDDIAYWDDDTRPFQEQIIAHANAEGMPDVCEDDLSVALSNPAVPDDPVFTIWCSRRGVERHIVETHFRPGVPFPTFKGERDADYDCMLAILASERASFSATQPGMYDRQRYTQYPNGVATMVMTLPGKNADGEEVKLTAECTFGGAELTRAVVTMRVGVKGPAEAE